jgi:hypothetical protein
LEAFNWIFSEGKTKLRRKISASGTIITWESQFRDWQAWQ